jgi:hypothetical protein
MSTYICPECGHENDFDPWINSAQCSQCGFEPPTGEEMGDYLNRQKDNSVGQPTANEDTEASGQGRSMPDRSGLAAFLPPTLQSFVTGLGLGLLTFALLMLISSWLDLPPTIAQCLGLAIPFLVVFSVWRWLF